MNPGETRAAYASARQSASGSKLMNCLKDEAKRGGMVKDTHSERSRLPETSLRMGGKSGGTPASAGRSACQGVDERRHFPAQSLRDVSCGIGFSRIMLTGPGMSLRGLPRCGIPPWLRPGSQDSRCGLLDRRGPVFGESILRRAGLFCTCSIESS